MFTNYGHRKLLAVLIAALLIFVMALSLTGCEKRGVCESCGQEEVLEEYTCTGRDGPYDEGGSCLLVQLLPANVQIHGLLTRKAARRAAKWKTAKNCQRRAVSGSCCI